MGNPKDNTNAKMRKQVRHKEAALPTEILKDDRFKDVVYDPKFRPIPKKEAKIKIDERFSKMFTDKRFKIKATLDKRGRPVTSTSTEDLKRYYHLDENDTDGDDDNVKQEATKSSGRSTSITSESSMKSKRGIPNKHWKSEDTSDSSSEESSEEELLDLARGEGNIETSEEDSSDSSDDEEAILQAEEKQEIEWNEMDKDAPRSEDVSKRLAVCNMDWHHLKAVDIFVLMNSFTPDGGVIRTVTIYPSEFGKERMREEAKRGPRLSAKNEQALRKYEFDRLKYYYAVVECDSSDTANRIYESCDGMEYQSSGARLDLRFIPDEMTFEQSEKTDYCDSAPEEYEPVDFVNTALLLSKCESNWDGDDLRRRKALSKVFSSDSKNKRKRAAGRNVKDIDKMAEHLKTYIASSDTDNDTDHEKINAEKYRKLLQVEGDDQQDDHSQSDDQEGGNKEITFNPELNVAIDRLRKEKNDSEKAKKLTPFQKYLERKKEKKREKRQLERAKKRREQTFSDDELPEVIDDDLFSKAGRMEDSEDEDVDEQNSNGAIDEETDERRRQELELLLMDNEDDGKKHFSLKKILRSEKAAAKKSKTKANRQVIVGDEVAEGDDFKIKLDDSRFAAIYSDHRFNIDPTDAGYRKTKAMEAILTEKAKRRRFNKIR
ncbi:ESF1-like [Tropilaelaps mercedesae]|uniref:ESF1-like n=1 Tax=Tropilaelaps mercedesae TaxID=418985 RepID=A0A1V9XV78_9ACAR|nr:ESF1-like [Tropilaelaps mercedesae]